MISLFTNAKDQIKTGKRSLKGEAQGLLKKRFEMILFKIM